MIVIPNVAIGKVLKPEHQGFPTSVGLLQPLWEGHLAMEMVYMFPARKCICQNSVPSTNEHAEWFTDVEDIARLHLASLLFPDVNGERLVSYGGRLNLNDVLAAFRKFDRSRVLPDDIPNLPKDVGKIDNERATELLRRLGRPGWVTLDESLEPLIEQYVKAKK